ncbi:hypothetical protein CDA63_16860 [Hymenobacter amundsenii]|uniref:Uncharacterized protein n=1 Tax=Hymenobacter amundsenii TaxID=2006685 RepID=A0A246FJY2_9BACT|nr:hypothetical protein [Hymenobacter amundsenii]OWP61915.1 hypothetical protein CDA63_16860 [Hymenobacter amundsenii]
MPNSSPIPLDVVALLEVFRMGLVTGLWDQQAVMAWADARVLAEQEPPEFVLDLALSGHRTRNDVVAALEGYIRSPRPAESGRVVLGLLHQQYTAGHLPLQRVVRTMDWLQWHGTFTEPERSFLAGVDDEYELAMAGVRGPTAAAVEALDQYVRWLLSFYEPLGLDNPAAWAQLVPEIASQVQAARPAHSSRNPQNGS